MQFSPFSLSLRVFFTFIHSFIRPFFEASWHGCLSCSPKARRRAYSYKNWIGQEYVHGNLLNFDLYAIFKKATHIERSEKK